MELHTPFSRNPTLQLTCACVTKDNESSTVYRCLQSTDVTKSKVAPNMTDPISLNETRPKP